MSWCQLTLKRASRLSKRPKHWRDQKGTRRRNSFSFNLSGVLDPLLVLTCNFLVYSNIKVKEWSNCCHQRPNRFWTWISLCGRKVSHRECLCCSLFNDDENVLPHAEDTAGLENFKEVNIPTIPKRKCIDVLIGQADNHLLTVLDEREVLTRENQTMY